ncbi:hypothetical protein RHGRI_010190 [Rhododendron griersonianum]|uniref:NECAP PHear domain-containing protein n=1 Tax=Rhododendron griersonianum TaxID=479676 RepID=A0AAV6KHK9_9ERIC|nr:hypothetical protein RHGRI_010190 [Rhododendron griersonianum]
MLDELKNLEFDTTEENCSFIQFQLQVLYRADEWNVNKWAWEGTLKVVSKGEECIIRLEDKTTGELYARAFLRDGEPHPVEAVIDSSRYFVLRIEEDIGNVFMAILIWTFSGGRLRHAFIGIGFRERTEAYDFQAALHDHMNYLNKKKTAEEMEQQYQNNSSVDYSLKDGETIVIQLKNKSGQSKFFEQGLNNLSLEEKANQKVSAIAIKPPPAPLSPVTTVKSPSDLPSSLSLDKTSGNREQSKEEHSLENQTAPDLPDDDFGDFQAAG